MSKKTRKKSSNTPAKRAAAKVPTKNTRIKKTEVKKSPIKTPAVKTRKALATQSGKPAKRAAPTASQKAASKSLKSSVSPVPKSGLAAEGAKAPAFQLPRDGGGSVSLADFAGKKLVLFFYPRADTPGCTREAIDFTRLNGDFTDSGTAVLGVSADTVKAQESFRNKHQLTIPLISDEKHEMLEAFGAWGEKSMYGRTFQGIIRTTILIDAQGRIAKIWRHVRVDGHADEVLAAARSL